MMVQVTATQVLNAAATGMTEGAPVYHILVAAAEAQRRPLDRWTPSPGAAPQEAGAVGTERIAGADAAEQFAWFE